MPFWVWLLGQLTAKLPAPPRLTALPSSLGARHRRLSQSQAPRSEVSCRRFGHQCIEAERASTERYHEEHTAHHREVPKEGVSVTARCRRITYGPIGMENQRKRKRVKEKGESYPSGIKP